jgi:hypothetical protein
MSYNKIKYKLTAVDYKNNTNSVCVDCAFNGYGMNCPRTFEEILICDADELNGKALKDDQTLRFDNISAILKDL